MRLTITALLMTLAAAFSAQASELDNEKAVTNEQIQLASELPATLVIRVNEATKEVEVLHSKDAIPADEATKAVVAAADFVKMDVKTGMNGELDRDSSRSSWYFCWPTYNWYYPNYLYAGYAYSYYNYYAYSWGGYSYNYFRWGY